MSAQDHESITAMRNSAGRLPSFTSVGSYPIVYLDSQESPLCPDCANENDPEYWPLMSAGINWEDPSLDCSECSSRIESAYAEDESNE